MAYNGGDGPGWPVGPNRSVSVGFPEVVGLCGLPHFPITSASPSHPRFLTRKLHFAQSLFFNTPLHCRGSWYA